MPARKQFFQETGVSLPNILISYRKTSVHIRGSTLLIQEGIHHIMTNIFQI